MPTAPVLKRLVQTYVDAWNEPQEARRRLLLQRSWAIRGIYTDPSVRIAGRDAMVTQSRRFVERWPGARVELASRVLEHHGLLCFRWRVVAADGAILREGIDFGRLGRNGKLNCIVGFFGPLRPPV